MNKSLIGAALVILVVVGVVFLSTDDNNDSSATTPNETTQSVDGAGEATSLETPTTGPATIEETDNSGTDSSSKTETITYTNDGFEPSELGPINVGDTVRFVNASQSLVWPASAVHPIHTELPGFDSLAGLASGGTYEFTFDEAGEWKFHNHLKSSQGGVITVQ